MLDSEIEGFQVRVSWEALRYVLACARHFIICLVLVQPRKTLSTYLSSYTLAIRYLIIIRGECKILKFEEKKKKTFQLSHLNKCLELLCGLSCYRGRRQTIPMWNIPWENNSSGHHYKSGACKSLSCVITW